MDGPRPTGEAAHGIPYERKYRYSVVTKAITGISGVNQL